MANLVPLYVDKENGNIVATNEDVEGWGGVPPGSAFGYVHNQVTSSDVWVVNHGKNTRALICQVYTTDMQHIHPDGTTINNENQITITFATPISGLAHLILFVV